MCLDLLCCCFGPAACGLCCGSGKVKSSITTRLLYFVFLFVVLVVCSIMLSPTVGAALGKVVSQNTDDMSYSIGVLYVVMLVSA